jgi:hypothetical protein
MPPYQQHRSEASDFLLEDGTGATVEIRMHQAEVKLPRRVHRSHDLAWVDQLRGYLPDWGDTALHQPTIIEHWLAAGDEVEVLGTVEHELDPQQEALPRDLPTRPVLVSTHGKPLTVRLVRAGVAANAAARRRTRALPAPGARGRRDRT